MQSRVLPVNKNTGNLSGLWGHLLRRSHPSAQWKDYGRHLRTKVVESTRNYTSNLRQAGTLGLASKSSTKLTRTSPIKPVTTQPRATKNQPSAKMPRQGRKGTVRLEKITTTTTANSSPKRCQFRRSFGTTSSRLGSLHFTRASTPSPQTYKRKMTTRE